MSKAESKGQETGGKAKDVSGAEESFEEKRKKTKGWVWLNANFTICMWKSGVYFRIYGVRRDGVFIESIVQVPEDIAKLYKESLMHLNGTIEEALRKFDTYEDCDCIVGKPCELHGRKK